MDSFLIEFFVDSFGPARDVAIVEMESFHNNNLLYFGPSEGVGGHTVFYD